YPMRIIKFYFLISLLAICELTVAQSFKGIDVESPTAEKQTGSVRLLLDLERKDWIYNVGEEAVFTISATRDGEAIKQGTLSFAIGPEKMKPTAQGTIAIKNGRAEINGGTMTTPGFLRCEIDLEIDGHH